MQDFKLLNVFSVHPELLIVSVFVTLILIIIVYKLDKLEKQVYKDTQKINEYEDRIKELEKAQVLEEEVEKDIIDRYLSSANKERVLNTQSDPIKTNDILKDSKVSSLLDPRRKDDDN